MGGANWMGGAELSKNLVLAANEVISMKGQQKDIEVVLLGGNLAELKSRLNISETAARQLSGMPWPPQFCYEEPPPWRAVPKLSRWFFGSWPNAEEQQRRHETKMLANEDFDFVYGLAEAPLSEAITSGGWIPDLQHCEFPDLFSNEECESRDQWIEASCREHDLIVFSSRHAREGFRNHFPRLDANTRTSVLPFRVGIDEQIFEKGPSRVAEQYGLPSEFLLVCNQFWKHKNHFVILDALSRLKEMGISPVVAMTGRLYDYRHPNYVDDLLRAVQERGLHGSVRLLGLIPKEDQLRLMTEAKAVIQPSLFEGWNTCVEECHALGTHMFLSDIPVHREQQPPCSHYFDPEDSEALGRLMSMPVPSVDLGSLEALKKYRNLFLEFGERFLEISGATNASSSEARIRS
ncbi:MAG: glycosyltransferase family 1 protein [Verrucomicrobiota bacterium]